MWDVLSIKLPKVRMLRNGLASHCKEGSAPKTVLKIYSEDTARSQSRK